MEKGQVFGLKCNELLAEYDPSSQSLKMCQPSLIEEESKSLDRLPNAGMMRNGKLYLQNKLELDTSENEYGLWRTPESGAGGTISKELLDYVADNKLRRPSGTLHQLRLQDQVRNTKLFPTPQAIDASAGQGISKNDKLIVKESGVIRKINKKGNDFGLTLSRHVMIEDQMREDFPTPTASMHKGSGPTILMKTGQDRRKSRLDYAIEQSDSRKSEEVGKLNPNWVEWLMGYPIGQTDLKDWETQ